MVGDGDFSFTASLRCLIDEHPGYHFVTSVLQSEREAITTYHPDNSVVVETIRWMEQSSRIHHYFSVDATNLNSTAKRCSIDDEPFDRVVFCYPFLASTCGLDDRKGLILDFFQAVRVWTGFQLDRGQVVLGLKSTSEDEDYQLDYWKVDDITNRSGCHRSSIVPSWRATHVNGKPLHKSEDIFDRGSVLVKFYAFQIQSR